MLCYIILSDPLHARREARALRRRRGGPAFYACFYFFNYRSLVYSYLCFLICSLYDLFIYILISCLYSLCYLCIPFSFYKYNILFMFSTIQLFSLLNIHTFLFLPSFLGLFYILSI